MYPPLLAPTTIYLQPNGEHCFGTTPSLPWLRERWLAMHGEEPQVEVNHLLYRSAGMFYDRHSARFRTFEDVRRVARTLHRKDITEWYDLEVLGEMHVRMWVTPEFLRDYAEGWHCGVCGAFSLAYDATDHRCVCPRCGARFDVLWVP